MKFEEAFSLMREGSCCVPKDLIGSSVYFFIKENTLLLFTGINSEFVENINHMDLFGEWEVYYETNS
jgi:hypothetical protein